MSAPAAPAAPGPATSDLLGVHEPSRPTATPHPTPAASSASLDDFFGGGARSAAPAKAEPDFSAMFGAPAMAGGEMIDFGLDAADIPPEYADLYAQEEVRVYVVLHTWVGTTTPATLLKMSVHRLYSMHIPKPCLSG